MEHDILVLSRETDHQLTPPCYKWLARLTSGRWRNDLSKANLWPDNAQKRFPFLIIDHLCWPCIAYMYACGRVQLHKNGQLSKHFLNRLRSNTPWVVSFQHALSHLVPTRLESFSFYCILSRLRSMPWVVFVPCLESSSFLALSRLRSMPWVVFVPCLESSSFLALSLLRSLPWVVFVPCLEPSSFQRALSRFALVHTINMTQGGYHRSAH